MCMPNTCTCHFLKTNKQAFVVNDHTYHTSTKETSDGNVLVRGLLLNSQSMFDADVNFIKDISVNAKDMLNSVVRKFMSRENISSMVKHILLEELEVQAQSLCSLRIPEMSVLRSTASVEKLQASDITQLCIKEMDERYYEYCKT